MQYLKKSFSVMSPGTEEYRQRWEATFGRAGTCPMNWHKSESERKNAPEEDTEKQEAIHSRPS